LVWCADHAWQAEAVRVACLPGRFTGGRLAVGVDQGSDRRIAAQLVQAAAAAWPDASDRDAQPGADLGVRHGRVFGEQGDQPLAPGSQPGERLAERRVPLGQQ
jgi:hypothetical protein